MLHENIKRRLYKLKDRLYLEAKYLAHYGFGIGQPIRYAIDQDQGKIVVETVDANTKHVAKTTQKTGVVVPVIDIKAQDVKAFFAMHKRIYVEIVEGKIIFTVAEAVEQAVCEDNVVSLDAARQKKVQLTSYAVSVKDVAKAVGYEQMTIFDFFQADSIDLSEPTTRAKGEQKAIRMLSLFSGCGTLDKAFKDQGYNIIFANDRYEKKALKDYHIQTYRENIGDHIHMGDVLALTEADIPQVDFLAAGVPCVTFSALNTVNNYRDSEHMLHPIVEKTIDIIQWSGAKAFLFENVVNFLTVKGGIMLKRLKERLPDFSFITKVIEATELGSAQKRKRAFVFATQGAEPKIELPLVHEVRTVRDAFQDIEKAPQQDQFFVPTPKILERMSYVPQGGNILSVPQELRAPNKKFSNYCQRLEMRNQSPTVTHVQDDVFFHPTIERYLTVRETARLFSLPDDFVFRGSLTAIFEMLKNAVDYRVSSFLAKTIKAQLNLV